MALSSGNRIGSYEVIGLLGAGGMGEVYRARDTKLNREVAIKVLPELFANDAERMARFTREAQTLAALNHPNIAAIYGLEESSMTRALVMELVEGDDLSELIGGLEHQTALAIARQIIDALEAAHDLGIIHRDLKPANIKVRHDGTVKVLDFGLAKAMDPQTSGIQDPANSPTLTARATQMGMIIGTAAYMSPEQARGRAVDKRTDVWAFGCVMFEMLSGKKTFDGDDATEIISSVVKSEPDWNALPATVPPHIRTIVSRCLIKDRKARIPDISVVRYMLDGTMPSGDVAVASVSRETKRSSSRTWQIATAAFLLTTLIAGAAWYRGGPADPEVTKFIILPPDGTGFTGGNNSGTTVPAVSPDGRSVAFTAQDAAGKRLLYVRPIDSIGAVPLAGTDGAAFPFWSPDSRSIGYSTVGKLMKIAATGGPVFTLCTLNPGITSRGGSWSREGVLIFNNGPAPLYRVAAAGGTAVAMGKLTEGHGGRQFPSFLPDGRHFLFHANGTTGGVYLGSLDSDEITRLLPSDSGAVYDRVSGRLLFVRDGTLLAQAFDADTHALSGEPVPIAERVEAAIVPGIVAFSISETGVLAYGIGVSAGSGLRLTWVNRRGETLSTIGPEVAYRGIDLSPDGQVVAVHRHEGEGGDIWLTDTSRNATSRFTLDPTQENSSPVWSPTGDRIAYQSVRDGKPGIQVKRSDGGGTEERVYETASSRYVIPLSWSPDGKTLLFGVAEVATNRDLWLLNLGGDRKAVPRLQTTSSELAGQISPDGRWLAYQSDETTRSEIYVQTMTGAPGKWVISNGGGSTPRWRADSRELFYGSGGKIWAVEIASKGDVLIPGVPQALFDYRGILNAAHPSYLVSYAVAKDGQKLLVTRQEKEGAAEAAASPAVVVLNWRSAIKK